MLEPTSRPSRPRNLVLIGFSYTGKSTIARIIGRRLGWSVVDTDTEIRRRTGQTPQEIFSSQGEQAFRAIEREVVADVCSRERQVIATGGGAPLDPQSRAQLYDGNVVVLLDSSPETIHRRLTQSCSGERRPLLEHPDPLGRIRELKSSRDPVYRQAHITVDTERLAPTESAEIILRMANVNHWVRGSGVRGRAADASTHATVEEEERA